MLSQNLHDKDFSKDTHKILLNSLFDLKLYHPNSLWKRQIRRLNKIYEKFAIKN